MTSKVLLVDDDPKVLAGYSRSLRKRFTLDTANGGQEGLERLQSNGEYAVVVADMKMPGMDGIQFLKEVQIKAPDTVRMMLTGNADQKTAVQAVNDGQVYRFLNKPCSTDLLALSLKNGIDHFNLIRREKELLEKTLMGSVQVLTEILSLSDPKLFGRGEKMRNYMRRFLNFSRLGDPASHWEFETAAMLSQIGFVGVPESVMEKVRAGSALTSKEQEVLDKVPKVGFDLLHQIPRLQSVAEIIRLQREGFQSAELEGDLGKTVQLGARLLKIFSDLLYLEAIPISVGKAFEKMQGRPGQYDPRLLDAVANCFCPQQADSEEVMETLEIDVEDLQVYDILKAGISTEEDTLIVAAGTEITLTLLRRLNSFKELYTFKTPIPIQRKLGFPVSS